MDDSDYGMDEPIGEVVVVTPTDNNNIDNRSAKNLQLVKQPTTNRIP